MGWVGWVGFASGHFSGGWGGKDNHGTGADGPLSLQRQMEKGHPGVWVSGAVGSWHPGGVLSRGLWSLQRRNRMAQPGPTRGQGLLSSPWRLPAGSSLVCPAPEPQFNDNPQRGAPQARSDSRCAGLEDSDENTSLVVFCHDSSVL